MIADHAHVDHVGAFAQIRRDRATFAKLAAMHADILLTSHPEVADVLGREARREAGDANAFIDPTALPRHVARARRAFENALAKAQRPGT